MNKFRMKKTRKITLRSQKISFSRAHLNFVPKMIPKINID
jgi:hypothetical protein